MLSWRDRLFRRSALGREIAIQADVGNARRVFAPPLHRAAYVYCDIPSGVLVAGGMFYTPPPQGAVVTAVHFGLDTGTTPGRIGLFDATLWQAQNWGEIGSITSVPLFPGRPLSGQVTPIQAMGVGDLARVGNNTMTICEIEVMPGNVFVLLATEAAQEMESALLIHEFLDDSDLNR